MTQQQLLAYQAVDVLVPASLWVLVIHQERDNVLCRCVYGVSWPCQEATENSRPGLAPACLSPHLESSAWPVCLLATP
jgi:hypothetical protein